MVKWSYHQKILASFFVASLILLAVGVMVAMSFQETRKQQAWVEHTYKVLGVLESILSDLKDIQSAQRGYVITGAEDYLSPYYSANAGVQEHVRELESLTSDNPEQSKRLDALKIHVTERINIAQEVIDIYREKGQKAAFDLIKKGTGKREMDEIRAIIKNMSATEEKLLEGRIDAVELSSKTTVTAGSLGLLLCLVILSIVFILIHRETKQRTKTELDLHKAVEEMAFISQEIKLIGRVGDYLRGCRSEREAYDIISKNMPLLFPHTYGSIAIFNNSRNTLNTVLSWGELPPVQNEFEPEDCWALRQGKIHEALNDGAVPMCAHLSGIERKTVCVCLPMQAQGQTIGQIFLGAHNADSLQEHQIATLRNTGEQISLALANLNLQRILKEQSIKDPLTKLFNRRYLEETLTRECIRAERNKQTLSLMIMDIDHFKKVNDTYGHDAGDAVLVGFSSLLKESSRKDDVVCRLGGEEFVIALPTASLELAVQRAEEIREKTSRMKVKFQNQTIPVTVSIGVSVFPTHGKTQEELLQNADLALYQAKRGGRDRVVAYDAAGNASSHG
jgi:diguanylate cyclase (GGDEF)-like protein